MWPTLADLSGQTLRQTSKKILDFTQFESMLRRQILQQDAHSLCNEKTTADEVKASRLKFGFLRFLFVVHMCPLKQQMWQGHESLRLEIPRDSGLARATRDGWLHMVAQCCTMLHMVAHGCTWLHGLVTTLLPPFYAQAKIAHKLYARCTLSTYNCTCTNIDITPAHAWSSWI